MIAQHIHTNGRAQPTCTQQVWRLCVYVAPCLRARTRRHGEEQCPRPRSIRKGKHTLAAPWVAPPACHNVGTHDRTTHAYQWSGAANLQAKGVVVRHTLIRGTNFTFRLSVPSLSVAPESTCSVASLSQFSGNQLPECRNLRHATLADC